MNAEIEKALPHALDGFGGFTEAVEGDTQPQSGVSLLGLKLKYLDPIWTDPDEQEIKGPLVVHDIQRKVQKWLDDTRPAETIVLTPGQSWPNIEKMNAECPKSEWREKFGKLQGPWQGENVVLFFDDKTMARYWWPAPVTTVGSAVCVRELVAQTKLMRSYKGEFVYPLVELSHTFMPTSYGGRERPNLVIKNWVRFGEGGSLVLPAPNKPVLTGSAAATAESKPAAASNPLGMQVVEEPSAKGGTGDVI